MSKRKEMDERLEKGIQLVAEIKKAYGKNSGGVHKCICGEMARFSIAYNNHIHFQCAHCKLSIHE